MTKFDFEAHILSEIVPMLGDPAMDIYTIFQTYNLTNKHEKIRDFLIASKALNKVDWRKMVRRREMEIEWGREPQNAIEFLDLFVNRTVKSWLPHRILIHGQDMPIDEAGLRVLCQAAVMEENLGYTDRDLDVAFSMLKLRMAREEYDDFRNLIAYDAKVLPEEKINEIWTLIRNCVFPNHDVEFVRRVIETFIWQVKRKMWGLIIPQPLMVVFEGPQNQGKSHFIEKHLLKCVPSKFFGKANFTQLLDNRNHDIKRKYVIWLDEMEHADKADITTLKSFMTAEYEESRIMYSNNGATVSNNTTLIGCMNGTLSQAIRDSTGYRRFVSLVFMKNAAMVGTTIHATLDSLPWLDLWKSVDEQSDKQPSEFVKEKILEQQADNTDESPVAVFLKDILRDRRAITSIFTHDGKVKVADLFKEYFDWGEQRHRSRSGVPFASDRGFGKELKRLVDHGEITSLARSPKCRDAVRYQLAVLGQGVDTQTFIATECIWS